MAIKTTPRYDNDAIKDELSKSGKSVREITPSPNFLTILESSGYKVHEALCDIIDNSIDAEATNILLTLGAENKKPYVIISDNGYGMTPDILFGALVLGASAAELGGRKKNGGSHGKYGTGMKSSMAELQGKNIIYTKVKGGELIKVHYDKIEHIDYKWLTANQLERLDWAAADRAIVKQLVSQKNINRV
mgnify:CR=1 FL=1